MVALRSPRRDNCLWSNPLPPLEVLGHSNFRQLPKVEWPICPNSPRRFLPRLPSAIRDRRAPAFSARRPSPGVHRPAFIAGGSSPGDRRLATGAWLTAAPCSIPPTSQPRPLRQQSPPPGGRPPAWPARRSNGAPRSSPPLAAAQSHTTPHPPAGSPARPAPATGRQSAATRAQFAPPQSAPGRESPAST